MSVTSEPVSEVGLGGNTLAGLCRLSIRAPETAFDLAVPTDIQLADLLPAVVSYAGADLDESGLKHGGWVLQRLGEEPLAPTGTADAHGLHDGEVLYLRPQREAMPAVHFDDLVDGVMSSLKTRADSWRPELSRRLLLGVMLATLVLGAGVLALPGPQVARNTVAVLAAVGLLGGALSVSRALGDAVIGTLLATAALFYLVPMAVLVPEGDGPTALHARLLAAGMVAVGTAALGYAAVGASAPLFLFCGAVGVLTSIAGMFYSATTEHTAEVTALIVVLAGIFVPGWSFWLSGLRLPPLPATAEQLQEGIDPHPSPYVLQRTAYADGYLTALLSALGVVYTGCLSVLVPMASSRWDLTLGAALSILAILHGRTLGATWQRLAVVVPGALGIGLLVVRYAWVGTDLRRILLVVVLLAAGGGLTLAARTIPGRRMIPHWARAGEIAHTLVAVSLLPLLFVTLGFYHRMRGLGG
ncbi:type VII secretion integral membrane protein EccD [Kineosporia mesophila]|uniref:Type VII secretion integral membrane protein EccD n=1 Tax=Kineosporia mesophila TaxID=566012 RepID=A0ABP6ZZ64_9ACTN|nr:type VII secretion integral membrane protein EccD [Kineosporia mesophila]